MKKFRKSLLNLMLFARILLLSSCQEFNFEEIIPLEEKESTLLGRGVSKGKRINYRGLYVEHRFSKPSYELKTKSTKHTCGTLKALFNRMRAKSGTKGKGLTSNVAEV